MKASELMVGNYVEQPGRIGVKKEHGYLIIKIICIILYYGTSTGNKK